MTEHPTSDESLTRVARFRAWALNHRYVSLFILVSIIIIAASQLTDALTKLRVFGTLFHRQSSYVILDTENRKNGACVLALKVINPPSSFEVETVRLKLHGPPIIGPVFGGPSGQVKAVPFDILIGEELFYSAEPYVDVPVRMYHDPKEPYALLELTLWWDRMNSRVTFTVEPEFYSVSGERLSLPFRPSTARVVLTNQTLYKGVLSSRSQ